MTEDSTNNTVSRRQFLKRLATGAGVGVLAGFGIPQGKRMLDSNTGIEQTTPITNASDKLKATATATPIVVIPQDLPPRDALNATATAVVEKGSTTSFIEDKEFSTEFFEKVRQSTVMVDIQGKKNGQVKAGTGTGWFAKDDEQYVLVTNSHHYHDFDEIQFIRYWRPGIDMQKTEPIGVIVNPMHSPDFAVAKFPIPQTQEKPITGLKYKDNVQLKTGDDILIVGFPSEFREKIDPLKSTIMGTHTKIEAIDLNTGEWFAPASINGGSSGSVAVINDNGEPVAVGIVFASDHLYWKDGEKITGRENRAIGIPLLIDKGLGKK